MSNRQRGLKRKQPSNQPSLFPSGEYEQAQLELGTEVAAKPDQYDQFMLYLSLEGKRQGVLKAADCLWADVPETPEHAELQAMQVVKQSSKYRDAWRSVIQRGLGEAMVARRQVDSTNPESPDNSPRIL